MQTFQFTESVEYIDKIVFSPDGRFLALSGRVVRLLDTTGEQPPEDLELGFSRFAFAFVRGGRAIAYQDYMHEFKVYDRKTERTRTRPFTRGHATGLIADQPGETLYLCMGTHKYPETASLQAVAASDLKTRASFARLQAESWSGITISADSRRLATSSWRAAEPSESEVRVWDLGGPKLPTRPDVHVTVPSTMNSLALTHDGSVLATASPSALSLWDTTTGKRVAHSGAHKRAVTAVACSPTRPVLVTADKAGRVFLWDTAGKVLKRYDWGMSAPWRSPRTACGAPRATWTGKS